MKILNRFKSRGRGKKYTLQCGVLEHVMAALYTRNWPRRLREKLPVQFNITMIIHKRFILEGKSVQCRLVFLSDIHIGPTTPYTLLDQVFASIRTANPDVLLLGGDYPDFDNCNLKRGRKGYF